MSSLPPKCQVLHRAPAGVEPVGSWTRTILHLTGRPPPIKCQFISTRIARLIWRPNSSHAAIYPSRNDSAFSTRNAQSFLALSSSMSSISFILSIHTGNAYITFTYFTYFFHNFYFQNPKSTSVFYNSCVYIMRENIFLYICSIYILHIPFSFILPHGLISP